MIKMCEICMKEYKSFLSRKNSRFCSRDCLSEWKKTAYKGRKLTPEWLKNQSESKKRSNIVKYGDYSCDSCKKKFETNLSLRAHTSYCHAVDKESYDCESCKRTFKTKRNLIMHQTLFHDVKRNVQHRLAASKGCEKRVMNSTSQEEKDFISVLINVYGEDDVVHKHRIDGISHEYDYFIKSKNIIVEFDGDYWHGNKELHELNDRMKIRYRIDQSLTRAAESKGFTVHRVWASEAVNYPHVLRKI